MVEKMHQNVLIVAGDLALSRSILEVLAARGLRGVVARNTAAAISKVQSSQWALVIVDIETPDLDGCEFVRAVKGDSPELPVVALGCEGSPATVVALMRAGYEDFRPKPIRPQPLAEMLDTFLPCHDVPLAAAAAEDTRCLYQIVGKSPRLLQVIEMARKLAPTSMPVLITGESGTGKELIAYFLHHHSARSRHPYVKVNCAALSESLLESELFGHEKGAFTGAYSQHKGRFERAHGGTLLLDEVSETGPRLQAELLRVLEQQDFERVGGSEPISVNVRIISTSNKDLRAEVGRGRFRSDLYYRIAGVNLTVPLLRDRKEDVPVLVWHFVNLYAAEVRRRITSLDGEMLKALCRYQWPGNVRQLRNVVRAALVFGEGPTLCMPPTAALQLSLQDPPTIDKPDLSLQGIEQRAILEALNRTNSHQAKAARLLGITDRTLREKLRRYRQEGSPQRKEQVACQTTPA